MIITAGEQHKYSCVMVNLPPIMSQHFIRLRKRINRRHWHEVEMAEIGEPHVTILYGLHDKSAAASHKLLVDLPLPVIQFGQVEIFEVPGKTYDVIVCRVKSPDLSRMNRSLRSLPHTNKFPEYKPHVTIGYVKKGRGKLYRNLDTGILTSRRFRLTDLVFSPAGEDAIIPLL